MAIRIELGLEREHFRCVWVPCCSVESRENSCNISFGEEANHRSSSAIYLYLFLCSAPQQHFEDVILTKWPKILIGLLVVEWKISIIIGMCWNSLISVRMKFHSVQIFQKIAFQKITTTLVTRWNSVCTSNKISFTFNRNRTTLQQFGDR